jgi:arylsulfatase A-like enzyme
MRTVLLSLGLVAVSATAGYAMPPHLLLIVADDLGWRDLRVQGNVKLRTPRLDALAEESIRFTDAYSASPVCSPTRAAMITGLAPARLRITQHGADTERFWPQDRTVQPPPTSGNLSLTTPTLAERLRRAGYATGFFGKWHLGESDPFWPGVRGFDINVGGCDLGGPPTYFDPYRIPTIEPRKPGEYLTDRLADEATTFLRRERERPMFVCLWTYNPHFPFEAPAELIEHYQGQEGPGLKNPIYGGQIEATDRAIGRVLDELDRLKIADETLVIFTSDNGGWTGATDNRPLREGKGYLYEGGIRVPLFVRWPGVTKAGTTNDTPVVTMDLAATILDAAGVSLSDGEHLDGVSLRPIFAGKKLDRDALFFHYPHFAFHKENRPGSAIRQGRFKLIHHYSDDSLELYDLAEDIGEQRDLAALKPQRASEMHERLISWLKKTNAALPTPRK